MVRTLTVPQVLHQAPNPTLSPWGFFMARQAIRTLHMCAPSTPGEVGLASAHMGLHAFIGVLGELEAAAQMV